MDNGSLAWKFQATANDIFLTGCINQPDGPNCPPSSSVNKDWDFGAGIMLAKKSDGTELVVAGQKSGVVWALNPDTGKVVFGAVIELEEQDGAHRVTYQVVGEDEADIRAGRISITSPIARAVVGKSEGDVVDVAAPGGIRSYEIVAVKYE